MKLIDHSALRVVTFFVVGIAWIATLVTPVAAQEKSTPSSDNARYRVEFIATWSADTHPHPGGDFPTSSAHFSPLIGAIHHEGISFWAVDALASAGIEQMAETGATGLLRGEIAAAMDAGTALAVIGGNGALSPGGTVIDEIELTADFPLVTLATMIAPSPDWFVGISGESLLDESNQWAAEKTFTLYPYDAGTDSGIDYTSPDADTDPAALIHSVRSQAPFSDAPIGTFTFTRMDEPENKIFLPTVCKK